MGGVWWIFEVDRVTWALAAALVAESGGAIEDAEHRNETVCTPGLAVDVRASSTYLKVSGFGVRGSDLRVRGSDFGFRAFLALMGREATCP